MSNIKKIIVIDDDPDERFFFSEALKNSAIAFNCSFYEDAVKALHILQSDNIETPDFIFVDLNMPKMSGMEFLTALRKLRRYSHVPVIVCSTSGFKKDIDDTIELGASY